MAALYFALLIASASPSSEAPQRGRMHADPADQAIHKTGSASREQAGTENADGVSPAAIGAGAGVQVEEIDENLIVTGLAAGASKTKVKAAAVTSSCQSPRVAVELLLAALQPDTYNPALAASCVFPAGSAVLTQQRAIEIKSVLDGGGLYVILDKVPAEAAHKDSLGLERYVLFASRPELYIEKTGERWMWSQETVQKIPEIFRKSMVVDFKSYADKFPQWSKFSVFGLALWHWGAVFLLLLFTYLIRTFVVVVVVTQGRGLMNRFGVSWGQDMLTQAGRPVGAMAGAGCIALFTPGLQLPVRHSQILLLAAEVVAAFSVVWTLYRLADLFAVWLTQRAQGTETKLDDQLVPLIRRALKILIVAMGTIFVLQNLDVDVTSLIAGFSLGGVAFALAAKDTISNLFGSATIFASRPFQIGDWVYIDGAEGVVESVGFRATRIRTFYNSLVSIPNNRVADAVVDNYGMRRYRRCKTMLGLTYDTTPEQMQAYVEGVRAIIKTNPATRKDVYEVHFYEFGASSLNILVYFFFEVPGWGDELRNRHNVFLDFLLLAQDIGVSFAFPTQTLHLESAATPQSRAAAPLKTPDELTAIVDGYGSGSRGKSEGIEFTGGYYAG